MSQKILVAEDSATMRLVIEMAFKGSPFEVVSTDSGETALKAAYTHRPSLVILDYHLPDGDSLQVCKAFKSDPNLREIPVLMLGGTYHPFSEDQAKLSGCNAVLMKPFKTDALTSRVQELVQARTAPVMSQVQPHLSRPDSPGVGLSTTVSPPPSRPLGESIGASRFGAPAPAGNRFPHPNSSRQPMRHPEPPLRPPAGNLRRPQQQPLTPAPQAFSRPAPPVTPVVAPKPVAPLAPRSRSVVAQPLPPAPAAAPSIDPETLNRLVREQVQLAVREQMLGMVRSVLNDLFKERILPRLLKYGEERIDTIVGDDIERLMHERIDDALARFVDNPPQ